jgi:hypothetical protein
MDDANSAPDGAATVVTGLKNWATTPFSTQMDLTHWFLFTGLIIVLCVLWILILRETLGEI